MFLLEALLIETLGSIFAKSATDLLTVGIPSMASLSKRVPVPILKASEVACAVTTTSSADVEPLKVTLT